MDKITIKNRQKEISQEETTDRGRRKNIVLFPFLSLQ